MNLHRDFFEVKLSPSSELYEKLPLEDLIVLTSLEGSGMDDFRKRNRDFFEKLQAVTHLYSPKMGEAANMYQFERLGSCLAPLQVLADSIGRMVLEQLKKPERACTPVVDSAALPRELFRNSLKLNKTRGGYLLSGSVSSVLNGVDFDRLLVPVGGRSGTLFVFVDRDASGVTERTEVAVDTTSRISAFTFKKVVVPQKQVLGALSAERLDEISARATIHLSSLASGVARRAVEVAVEHAGTRSNDGVGPIGRFQGISHRCANMFIALEKLKSLLMYVAEVFPTTRDARLVSMLKAAADNTLLECAQDAIQIMGAKAFQWDSVTNLLLRRAMMIRTMLGTTHFHLMSFSKEILSPTGKGLQDNNCATIGISSFEKTERKSPDESFEVFQ